MTTKVKWIGKNQAGETAAWAGDGSATIVSMQDEVSGFGIGAEVKGPAVLLEFAGGYQAWVSPAEVEQVP